MNRLHASLSAAIVVSSFFFASNALADEETISEEASIEEQKIETPVIASPSPVDADSNVSPHGKNDRSRVGALVGVGFPRPLSVEGFVKINRLVGVGAEYGFLPRTSISSAEIEMKSVSAEGRFFPFRNGFFIGLRGGRQWVDASASASARQGTVNATATATASISTATWFVNPRIGVLHTFESGITLGVEVGVQIPIAPELAMEQSNTGPAAADATRAMRSAANTLGNETTPTIDLLRVGFLF